MGRKRFDEVLKVPVKVVVLNHDFGEDPNYAAYYQGFAFKRDLYNWPDGVESIEQASDHNSTTVTFKEARTGSITLAVL